MQSQEQAPIRDTAEKAYTPQRELETSYGLGSNNYSDIQSIKSRRLDTSIDHLPDFYLSSNHYADGLTRETARAAAGGWAASYDMAANGDKQSQQTIYDIAAQWKSLPPDSPMSAYVSQILSDMMSINPQAHAAFVTAMQKGPGSIDFSSGKKR